MASIFRMVLVLSLLCGTSGFVLSYLKTLTAPVIEEQVLTYVQGPALTRIFPDADNSPIADRKIFTLENGTSVTLFPAIKDGALYGVALEGTGPGYGGDLGVMVGFDIQTDTLLGVAMTSLKETPGIGTLVAEPVFTRQFMGLDLPVALTKDGGRVDALSGATISSTGVVEAVKSATMVFHALDKQIRTAWGKKPA